MERLELETMRLEKEGKLAWITFTRTRYLNAMNNQGTLDLNTLADHLYDDPDVRMVVIRGEGRAFSTGIDLKQLSADDIEMIYHHRWERALRRFETMEKLVIVGMQGYCLGGALQLALACDIRVATADCQLGLPAIKESLIPGLSTWRLPKYVGLGRAKRLIFSGENVSGEEGLRIGLVDHVVDNENFFKQLDDIAAYYMRGNSEGTRMSKMILNESFDRPYDSVLHYYFTLQERAQFSPDGEEGKRAYLENRDPVWQ